MLNRMLYGVDAVMSAIHGNGLKSTRRRREILQARALLNDVFDSARGLRKDVGDSVDGGNERWRRKKFSWKHKNCTCKIFGIS